MWPFRRRRLFFRYHDGRRWIAADPLPLYRRIVREADRLAVLGAGFDEQRDPEADEFVALLAEIFALQRYDPATGIGLTDTEVAAVFQQFDAFLQEVRARFFRGSTSQPTTAGGSSPSPESGPGTPDGG